MPTQPTADLRALPTAIAPWRRYLTQLLWVHTALFGAATGWAGSLVDLVIRIGIAQSFFLEGMMRTMHAHTGAMQTPLMRPVDALMGPLIQSGSASWVEVVLAIVFAAGFLTQLSALALFLWVLSGEGVFTGDPRLLVSALLLRYVFAGAGALSIDGLFEGLASSALTVAASVSKITRWMCDRALPGFDTAVRIWLGLAFLEAARPNLFASIDQLLPAIPSALNFPSHPWLPELAGVLLVLGAGVRYCAIGFLFTMSAWAMMGTRGGAESYWVLLWVLIALWGARVLSLDALVARFLRRIFPEVEGKPAFSIEGLPRVVIVGAGFGGLSCAQALRHVPVSVTLIDRSNHHLFQPLLYQVATASLSPGDIATPVRSLFRDAINVRVVYGTVSGIDTHAQAVRLASTSIPYDYLVLATGATHGYFGNDAWQTHAPGLKRLEDATEIRRRLLTAFENAELAEDESEREALLTFLVVGGGPTGVELAGAIAELARLGMDKDFRRFDPAKARIILVQSANRILPMFPAALSAIAQRSLEKLGVEVRTDSRVEAIDATGVRMGGDRIAARTVLWAAGVVASPAGQWLGAPCDPAGRVSVGPDLGVPGHAGVFAIGDTASSKAWQGRDVPGLAPAAKQAGNYVARTIAALVSGRAAPLPFKYRHFGSLAAIGRKSAVVDFGKLQLWGALAWWLWGVLHVGLLVGVRNRVTTVVNWFWSYITFRSAVRLITGIETRELRQGRPDT
jgi:putative oxidoreductase